MNTYQPSPAFQAYFNAVIAMAEGPVTAGVFTLAVPTLTNPREKVFAETILVPLITSINAMKATVTPPPPAYAAQAEAVGMTNEEYLAVIQQQQSMSTP